VKTTHGKGATKVGLKKIDFDFLCGYGLERTTKTILVGIFTDITLFTPYRGLIVLGEIFLLDFFRENGSQGTTKTISAGIFAVITYFHPFLEVGIWGEIFYSIFVKMAR